MRGRQGGLGCDSGGETLYPPATLAPLSTSCLSASLHRHSCLVMPAVNGHTQHTSTITPDILHRRKSFRSHPWLASGWLHMVAAKQKSQSHFSLMISSWQIHVKAYVSHPELQPVTSVVQTMCHLDCLYTHTQCQHRIIHLVNDLILTQKLCACVADYQHTSLPK